MSRCWKILISVGAALVIAVLLSIIHHYRLRAATDAYIAQLKAQGEPMELAQVIPPPVPPEQNGALLITNALAQIDTEEIYTNSLLFKNDPLGMSRSIEPGKEIVGWQQPVIHDLEGYGGGYYPTNTWEDLGTQLARRGKNLNDLRKLIEMPTLDFDLDYSDIGAFGQMSYLMQLKYAVQWLEVSECYNLHVGKTADACTDIRAMLALIKGETRERYEISQLVRFAFVQMTAGATWDLLQATNGSDENLAQLQRDWQALRLVAPLRNAFLFERVNQQRLLEHFRQSPTNLSWWLGSILVQKGYDYEKTGEGSSARWVLVDKSPPFKKLMNKISIPWNDVQWRWFWSYKDGLRALQIWGVVLDGTQQLETNSSFLSVQSFVNTNFTRLDLDTVKHNPYLVASQNAMSQLSAIRKVANAEVARNVVLTAIALKRYELRNRRLPTTLDELVPEFLKSVPIDCMDGRPLRYRPNPDGTFLLYSVSENGRDDGGNPAQPSNHNDFPDYGWNDSRALDWVWPQPATPQEIRAYYARQKSGN